MKLEATIAPRRLSPSQLASIASRLRQFNGRILMLSSFGTDVDSAILAQQIASAAKSAGLGVASQIGGLVGGPLRTGVHVDLFTDSADTEFAEAVRSALDGLGLSVAPKVGRASKGGSKLNPASVSVFVGPKPTAR
jgi:hypothetical protein